MTEQERDKVLHNAEVRVMKNKINSKNIEVQKQYGAMAVAIHRDRTMLLRCIDKDKNVGICACGNLVEICDKPIYCKYCGQRTSGTFGWTVDDYYNER